MAKLSETYGVGATPAPSVKQNTVIPKAVGLSASYSSKNNYEPKPTESVAPSSPLVMMSKNGDRITQNNINTWLSDGYKMNADEQKKAKELYKQFSAYSKVGNNPYAQRNYLNSLSDSDRELALNADKLYNKVSNLGSFVGGALSAIPGYTKATDKALNYLGADENSFSNNINAQKSQNPLASMAGQATSKIAQYSAFNSLPFVKPVAEGLGNALGGSKVAQALGGGNAARKLVVDNVSKALGRIGADTMADIALDTVPEVVDNIQSGKSGKEVAIDALKNLGGNVAFNAIPEAVGGLKALNEIRKNKKVVDSALEGVEKIAKSADDVKVADKVVESTEPIAETIVKPTLTNKEIDEILIDATKKAEFENTYGIKLDGTKAEQRKQIKSFLNDATDIAEKKPTVAVKGDETTSTIKSTLEDESALNRSKSPREMEENIGLETERLVGGLDEMNKGYADAEVNGLKGNDVNTSRVYSNAYQKNGLADMKKEADRLASQYKVLHDVDVTEGAKEMIAREGIDNLSMQYIEGTRAIESGSDVDAAMMILIEKKKLLDSATDPIDKMNLTAEIDMLKRQLRKAGTKGGQFVESFRKWSGTSEGAIKQGESILDKKAVKWSKKNPKEAEKVDNLAKKIENVAKQKTNSKLDSALKDMGNKNGGNRIDTLRLTKDGKPKSHEEIVKEVKASFEKELGSIEGKLNDTDIEFVSSMVENNVPKADIINELEQRLKNGKWYTLDESVPEKVELDGQIKSALNNMFKEEDVVAEEVKLSREEIRKQIAETLKTESASMDFDDADIDYLTSLKVSGANSSEIADALKTRVATGTWGISQETVDKVNDIFKLAELQDINSKERVKLEDQAFGLIAEDIFKGQKASFWEKFDEWRYLAMLGNGKTHARNIISNIVFNAETSVSNTIASGIEKAVNKITNGKVERTKAIINPATDGNLLKATLNDANEASFRQLSGQKYSNGVERNIVDKRKTFKSKSLNFLSKGNSKLLSKEDEIFTHAKYSTSLAGYLKAKGLDESVFSAEKRLKEVEARLDNLKNGRLPSLSDADIKEQIKASESLKKTLEGMVDTLNKGREYAIKQAEYATFHEDANLASKISKFVRDSKESDKLSEKALGKLVEGIIPFTKTPINVLKSGLEYSPLNAFANAFDVYKLKKGTINANEFIENISKTLTGTGVYALGYWLSSRGLLTGGYNDKSTFDNNRGVQKYALKIGNKTYTIDQFAPACMPLLMGAEAQKILAPQGKETEGLDYILSDEFEKQINGQKINNVINAALGIVNPIFETSMLSGVNDTISTFQNGEGNALTNAATNALTGYFTQAIPTVAGQVARTVDNTRRSTYTENTGPVGAIEKKIKKATNKIPGLSSMSEAYVDLWGREQKNSSDNIGARVLDNFLNPTYVGDISNDPVDNEISRLYDTTQDKASLPGNFYNKIDGARLTEKQYHDVSVATGKARHDVIDALIKTDFYKNASDDTKVDYIKSVYDLANKVGKHTIDKKGDAESDKLYKAYTQMGTDGAIKYLQIKNAPDLDGNGKVNKAEILDYLGRNYNDRQAQKWIDFLYPPKEKK